MPVEYPESLLRLDGFLGGSDGRSWRAVTVLLDELDLFLGVSSPRAGSSVATSSPSDSDSQVTGFGPPIVYC